MPFVAFEESGNSPTISIRANGRIGFNNEARKLIGDADYVVLYINAEDQQIGIKPVHDESIPGARYVRRPRGDAFILAEDFLKKFGLDHIRDRLICRWDKEAVMLVADYSGQAVRIIEVDF